MSKPEITDFAFGHLSTIFSDEPQDHSSLQKNELPPQEMAPGHTDEVSTVTKEPPVYSKTKRTKKELPQLPSILTTTTAVPLSMMVIFILTKPLILSLLWLPLHPTTDLN